MSKWQLLILTLVSVISYIAVRLIVGLALPLVVAYIIYCIVTGH